MPSDNSSKGLILLYIFVCVVDNKIRYRILNYV